MSVFLFASEREAADKISIDNLFDRNHKRDLQQLSVFNKILNRAHTRITTTSARKRDKFTLFVVPEYIFGEPLFSTADCIAYVISKLSENGFEVKYLHPNTLFISWEAYVPAYVRAEFKKKTGRAVDERGVVQAPEADPEAAEDAPGVPGAGRKDRKYAPISQYHPTGNLVYSQEVFDRLEKKMASSD